MMLETDPFSLLYGFYRPKEAFLNIVKIFAALKENYYKPK
jgi:hypothetical protein